MKTIRAVRTDGKLYASRELRDVQRLYPLYANHAALCPPTSLPEDKFLAEMLEKLSNPKNDLWIYEEGDGTIATYQLTQIEGLTLKLVCGVYHPDINITSTLELMRDIFDAIGRNSGCTELYWTCHISAVKILEYMDTLGTRLIVPRYPVGPEVVEYIRKI